MKPAYIKFKDLAIGDKFIFSSEIEFPFSGMKSGPWKKISTRKYINVDEYDKTCLVYTVGSVSAYVIKQSE